MHFISFGHSVVSLRQALSAAGLIARVTLRSDGSPLHQLKPTHRGRVDGPPLCFRLLVQRFTPPALCYCLFSRRGWMCCQHFTCFAVRAVISTAAQEVFSTLCCEESVVGHQIIRYRCWHRFGCQRRWRCVLFHHRVFDGRSLCRCGSSPFIAVSFRRCSYGRQLGFA